MNKFASTLAKVSGGLLVLCALAMPAAEDYLNTHPLAGCLLGAVVIICGSLVSFSLGTLMQWEKSSHDSAMRWAARAGTVAVLLSFVQLPLWVSLTGQFPPDKFSGLTAAIATAAIGFSILGPLLPFFVSTRRNWASRHGG